jgi:hypothetical protein
MEKIEIFILQWNEKNLYSFLLHNQKVLLMNSQNYFCYTRIDALIFHVNLVPTNQISVRRGIEPLVHWCIAKIRVNIIFNMHTMKSKMQIKFKNAILMWIILFLQFYISLPILD